MPAAVLSVLKQLTGANHTAVDRAIAAALPTADPDEARHLARALLDRKRPPGLLGLVLFFHLLPEDTQHQIIDHAPHLDRALREAAATPSTKASGPSKTNSTAPATAGKPPQGPANALTIIQAANAPAMAYLVIETLRRNADDLRDQATACLTTLLQHAQTTPTPGPPPHTSPRHAALLFAAVDHALGQSAREPHPALLDAWARLIPRPMPHTQAALRDPHADLALELRARLIAGHPQHWLQALLPALLHPALTHAGIDGLQVAAQQRHLPTALQRGHFLTLQSVRKALGHTQEPTRLLPPDTPEARDTNVQPQASDRWLPAYLEALPLPHEDRDARLTDLATHPDPAVRLAALRRLIPQLAPPQLDQPAPSELRDAIVRFTEDPLPAIARTAVHALLHDHRRNPTAAPAADPHAPNPYAELLARLVNSPHPDIAQRASNALGPIAFDRLWSNWPRLTLRQRLAAGRALLRAHPDPYRPLAQHLASPRKPQRLRALNIIATLGQADLFEPALLRLADHPDASVAASAIRALGSATSSAAQQRLLTALDHADPRVRANAIEALALADPAHRDAPPTDTLTRIATHDDNRPRANAIAALARLGITEHTQLLDGMLRDPRAAHRLSALWLIDHLDRLDLATTAAEAAVSDPDPTVRLKAKQITDRLIERLHPEEKLEVGI
ncbi:MAG: HEAT repeat domain-containing protein [Planctomycetota bacterium]